MSCFCCICSAHKELIKQLNYSSFEEIFTGDHKPVHSGFGVSQPKTLVHIDHSLDAAAGPKIDFRGFSAAGLRSADINGKSDPYIAFHAHPPTIFTASVDKPGRSNHKNATLDPVWDDNDIRECTCSILHYYNTL